MNEDAAPQSKNAPAPLNASFEVTLKMISDWHVGSGAGRPGNIDRLVRRDAEDLPYVPAKTLTGIWRDACESVALGLDEGNQNGVWNQWVAYLFGDQPAIKDAERTQGKPAEEQASPSDDGDWRPPQAAVLSVRSAHLPADLRQALKTKPVAREAITFIKPGISIHPRTGRARAEFLRFEEMARGGVTLSAVCELRGELKEEDRRIASALLIAGARLVERLGGKRRRGAGRCELIIVRSEEIEPWLDWIEAYPQPQPPKHHETEDSSNSAQASVIAASGAWLRIRLILTTKLPVIVPAGTIGNLIETLDYIPGTYLLPHVTKKLSGVNAQAAIARGDLVVTNATAEIEGERGRPVPFSLFYRKSEGGLKDGQGVFNRLCERGPESQPKNHRAGYVGSTANVRLNGQSGRLPVFDTLDPQVETHNVVEDKWQRPTEAVGGVYSYQAIPPGVTLRAELRLRQSLNDALSQKDPKWFSKLEGELSIGRASKDDYGAVKLRIIGQPESAPNAEAVKEELTVWLLSDLLLRDERLRPVASVERLGQVLQEKLNVGVEESRQTKLELRKDRDKDSAFPRQRRTDSWHVRWGLPRPSLAGLQAGACAVFRVEGQIDPARLSEIEAGGLGERRAEGYGQVCFNDPLVTSELEKLKGAKPTKEETIEAPFLVPKQSAFDYARLIERAAARNEMRRCAPGLAADRDNRQKALGILLNGTQSKPRMSQLGALRSALSRLRSAADGHRVLAWLERLGQTPNRRDEWPVGSLKRVSELITQNERVWELLNIDFTKLTLAKDGAEELKQELWPEAVRALVDACVQAHKRELEGARRDG
ncbi:MAG: RAMP superfamily CRISPR-associated protein [Acidobacteriota bacterium]